MSASVMERVGATRGAATLVITGMAKESACAAGEGVRILCSGADTGRLRGLLAEFSGEASAVVSFGLAGGLHPELASGDVIIGEETIFDGGRLATDAKLAGHLRENLGRAGVLALSGLVAGVDAPVMTAAAKARLRADTAAVIVDMETHVAAQFAAARGVPFAVLRVVCDPHDRALPQAAAKAVTPDGGVNIAHILKELAREPGQLPDLLAAGRDARAAFAALRRCGPLLGALPSLVLAGL